MKNFTKLRGMLDIDPILSSKYSFIESAFNKIAKSYGYKEVRFPISEGRAVSSLRHNSRRVKLVRFPKDSGTEVS